MIYGKGLDAGISTDGDLFIGDYELLQRDATRRILREALKTGLELRFEARPAGDKAVLTITAADPVSKAVIATVEQSDVDPALLAGNLALVSHLPELKRPEDGPSAWFEDWTIDGDRVAAQEGGAFGPILFAQYTLSRGVMKMTAQLPPVGLVDGKTVKLQVRKADGSWMDVADAPIDPDARTAGFRVAGWDTARDVPYRLVYELAAGRGSLEALYLRGHGAARARRQEPDRPGRVLLPERHRLSPRRGARPRQELRPGPAVFLRRPDLRAGGRLRDPVRASRIRHPRLSAQVVSLRLGLRRDPARPADDHHPRRPRRLSRQPLGRWPARRPSPGIGMEAQDSGGYKMPARWVNMVQRTQTSHLPDPADPAPVEQGIGVYFCDVRYAGLSLAVIEDRKFKSAPKALLPDAQIRNGWAQNPDWKADKESDAKGAELLGERQMKFLQELGGGLDRAAPG